MKKHTLIPALMAVVLALPLHAQFWQKKPHTEWSAKDCAKLLRDSPWAATKVLGQVQIRSLTEAPGGMPASSENPLAGSGAPSQPSSPIPEGRSANPQITYVAQLWSATPVREAYVRQVQLHESYKNMGEEERAKRDQELARVLGAEFSEVVVVRVFYGSNVQTYARELTSHWEKQGPVLKNLVQLTGGRGTVHPRDIIVPPGAGEIQFIFPRLINGEPLLSRQDKALSLQFESPQIGGLPYGRVFFSFEVKKMLLNGEVEY